MAALGLLYNRIAAHERADAAGAYIDGLLKPGALQLRCQ